jgi:hypothetical protein
MIESHPIFPLTLFSVVAFGGRATVIIVVVVVVACFQTLQGENAELDALAKKLDALEGDKAAVKQRLSDAIVKVSC